jgi:hypothetical protein
LILILNVAASILFGMLASNALSNLVHGGKIFEHTIRSTPEAQQTSIKRFVRFRTILTFCALMSFIAAAVLVWVHWPLALVIGLWPVASLAVAVITKRVTVITQEYPDSRP